MGHSQFVRLNAVRKTKKDRHGTIELEHGTGQVFKPNIEYVFRLSPICLRVLSSCRNLYSSMEMTVKYCNFESFGLKCMNAGSKTPVFFVVPGAVSLLDSFCQHLFAQ